MNRWRAIAILIAALLPSQAGESHPLAACQIINATASERVRLSHGKTLLAEEFLSGQRITGLSFPRGKLKLLIENDTETRQEVEVDVSEVDAYAIVIQDSLGETPPWKASLIELDANADEGITIHLLNATQDLPVTIEVRDRQPVVFAPKSIERIDAPRPANLAATLKAGSSTRILRLAQPASHARDILILITGREGDLSVRSFKL